MTKGEGGEAVWLADFTAYARRKIAQVGCENLQFCDGEAVVNGRRRCTNCGGLIDG